MSVIGDASLSFIMRRSLGDKSIVTSTDQDVVRADGRTRVFAQQQWEALRPAPLDAEDRDDP